MSPVDDATPGRSRWSRRTHRTRRRFPPTCLLAVFPAALVLSWACGDATAPDPPNPTPGITSLSPSEVVAGSPDLTLTVQGSDFVPSSVVRLDGTQRPTHYVSASELTISVTAISAPRSRQIRRNGAVVIPHRGASSTRAPLGSPGGPTAEETCSGREIMGE